MVSVLGLWLVGGVFLDGWAHVNKTALETFFTPWHGVLYSGALALFGYVAVLRRRYGATPAGYELAVWGGPLFLAGGGADFVWHQLFGIEVGLDALLSPTHLILLASGVMVLLTPWRADIRRTSTPTIAGVLSLALTSSLVAFFLLYVSAFAEPYAATALTRIPEGAPGHEAAEVPAALGLGAYLVTTAVVLVPTILLLRRGRPPFGSTALLLGLVAGLTTIVVEARQPLVPLAAVLAGLVVDSLMRRTEGVPAPVRVPALAASLAAVLWVLQLVGLAISDQVAWPVELWSGSVLLTAAFAALVGYLSTSAPTPIAGPQPRTAASSV